MTANPAADGAAAATVMDDWLGEFARETRTTVLARVASSGSCILSTRVGLEVLRFFGIPARPVPVRIVAHGPGTDPWSVGIMGSGRMGPETWDGHLVLSLPTQQRLVDLSLDQMNRVQRGLELGPAVAETPPGWGSAGDTVAGYAGEVLVAWQVIAGRGYTRCPDWSARRAGVVRDAAADAIRRLRTSGGTAEGPVPPVAHDTGVPGPVRAER